jgi:hypothetical protein
MLDKLSECLSLSLILSANLTKTAKAQNTPVPVAKDLLSIIRQSLGTIITQGVEGDLNS